MEENGIRVLHVNCNYIGTKLHRVMLSNFDDSIRSFVYCPAFYNCEDMEQFEPEENVLAIECFRYNDRYFFDWKQHKILRTAKKNIPVHDFDVIHAHTLFTDGNCAMRLSRTFHIPYIVAVRGTDLASFYRRQPYLRSRGTRIMRGASRVVFLSETYRDIILNEYVDERYRRELREKSIVIPNGIDRFWLENTNCAEKEPDGERVLLLFVGRIIKRKNPGILIDAMDCLAEKGVEARLTVVGTQEDEELISRLRADPRVVCLPAMKKEDLIWEYRKADIFTVPSLVETFGLVYAEALSQGLPVIYTKNEGFDGQFPDGVVGYPVDPRDPEDIAEKILSILGNYRAIQSRCAASASVYGWDGISETYKQLYIEAIRRD